MALCAVAFRTNFFLHRGLNSLCRNNVLVPTCYDIQCRHVQSQRDMRKDSRVTRPWHKWMEKFDNKFERKYPKIYRVYALFKQGTKDFISDSKQFYRVSMRIRSGEPLNKFSRAELELLLQLPPQAVKVIPMIILSVAPFGFYLVIPLAYFFPRQLLCRHYWTPEQRVGFASLDVKRRLGHCDAILVHLQESCDRMNETEKKALSNLVNKLNSRFVPAVDDVLAAKTAFSHDTLSVRSMPWFNLMNLSRSVNLSFWRSRLRHSCRILMAADRALSRESVDLLNETELRQACATRGLNPAGITKKEMTIYLKSWLDISLKLKDNDTSLLLHTPTILARNHPNNTKLRRS